MNTRMSTPVEPLLAPPGAGLPLVELWLARLLFTVRRLRGSRDLFVARFEQERAAIRALVASCAESKRGEQVLIERPRGLEDSSRNWSVWMTLDHLRITNTGVSRVITALTHGKVPPGKASTAAVKPTATVTAAVEEEFEHSCDGVLTAINEASDLKTRVRFAHPWFGALDAFGWAAMAGAHMGLHRGQMEKILAGVSR